MFNYVIQGDQVKGCSSGLTYQVGLAQLGYVSTYVSMMSLPQLGLAKHRIGGIDADRKKNLLESR